VQPLAPITAPNEMAEDISNVIEKLNSDQEYKKMFKAAFGDETVNSQRMLKALAQFMAAMVSADSKYDRVMRKEATFTEAEQKGYELFKAKCASCHKEPLFTDLSFRNNGLPVNNSLKDVGRMTITNLSSDSLLFKVPSLRNMMLTFPYMHDGRFKSPLQVLNHYTEGIEDGPTVDPLLKDKVAITYQEKFYFLEFFKTLTDSAFVNDKRFSHPE
jgi:cytochrome c peroxidase